MRVAFLTNIVSPYRLPVFQRLAQTPDWDFRVMVNAMSEFDRSWAVSHNACPVRKSKTWSLRRTVHSDVPVPFDQTITLHFPVGLWGDLRRFRPQVVISHELGPRTMLAAAYCKAYGIPLVIWSYQSLVSATQGSGLKQIVRRRLISQASCLIGMGGQARDVLRGWGASDENIIDAPNTADNETLIRRYADAASKNAAQKLRWEFGKGRKIATVIGRLVPLKGTAALLEQWSALPQSIRDQWRLVFVGEGPLAKLVQDSEDDSVYHAGQADATLMADWYQASDLHIFPTLGDVWGLVVNEAMLCGTPTLCSVHAGCSTDMIHDGCNGFTYDPTVSDAASRLHAALTHPQLGRVGEQARRTANQFTPDRLAHGFREAVNKVTRITEYEELIPAVA
ncbi:glycosyltransferase family 4 protein [Algisphaera agarilytica]